MAPLIVFFVVVYAVPDAADGRVDDFSVVLLTPFLTQGKGGFVCCLAVVVTAVVDCFITWTLPV